MSLSEGQVLNNRYRVTSLVGQSEFGAFYLVWDQNSNIPCLVEEIADASEAARLIFSQQAAQTYQLRHPNLPRILEAFSVSGQGLYLVMQHVEGQDLQSVFDQTDGPLTGDIVLPAAVQVCEALNYLHSQTPFIVHGDVKPANIILTSQAGAQKAGKTGATVLVGLGVGTKIDSQTGAITGTRAISPGFSPPESYGKGKIDRRSDVYALGASLYYLLAGKRLPESVLIKSRDVQPPKAPYEFNPLIPQGVSAAIMRAIQVEPDSRFTNAEEFKRALQASLPAAPPAQQRKSTNRLPLVIGGVVVAVIILALVIGAGLMASSYFTAMNDTDTPLPPSATFTTAVTATLPDTATSPPPTATLPIALPPTPTGLASSIEDGRGVPMVLVPAGEFLMGSNFGGNEEQPEHTVTLSSYYIDTYEVTNARYAQCVSEGACDSPDQFNSATRPSYYGNPEFADFPVLMVTWNKAQDYCSWRNASLPTEAQWEKAARGTDFRIFPWPGEEADCSLANFWNNEPSCQRDTITVGSYPTGVSPFGLFDMAGNVWEWVADFFNPNYYASSPAENPTGPGEGDYRVVRGGSFSGGMGQIRVTTRGRNLPGNGYNYVGFRCVKPAP